MKKLLILSGKGGTGKTTVASAFIHMLSSKSYADCDVDAPNLHITAPVDGKEEREEYFGLPKASIDHNLCIGCGVCVKHCRFHAITLNKMAEIDPFACEGCRVCSYVCPVDAITMKDDQSGEVISYDGAKHFVTGHLTMGAGASGKLVAQVKSHMKEIKEDDEIAIIDGSPGIGCPVIASVSGVDMVLIVTEPTVSGISDFKRILKTVRWFQSKCAVCINKYDISPENTKELTDVCQQEGVPIAGVLSYDPAASSAINQGKSIVDIDCKVGREVRQVINETLKIINA